MIGIVDSVTGELLQVVVSTEGVDLEGMTTVDVPDGYLAQELEWDVPGQAFVDAGPALARFTAHLYIDLKAGHRKADIGSLGKFIDATYTAKEAEAYRYAADRAAWLAGEADDPDSSLSEYPYIWRGIGVDADTAYGVAQVYMNLSYIWHDYNSRVEAVRISTKQEIEAAETREAIKAIVAAVEWPPLPA